MDLSVSERLVLLNVLPTEGDILTLKLTRDMVNNVGFSEEDLSALNFVENEELQQVTWDEGFPVKTVGFGPKGLEVIIKAFEKLSRDGKMTMEHLPVAERFIDEAAALAGEQ